jgi:hypothetical protein
MTLRVDSSTTTTKAILGVAAFSVLALGTALFLRSRGNAAAAPAAPSLDQRRLAFLADIPLVGRVYTHFNPAKKPEPINIQIGSLPPIKNVDELRQAFSVEMQRIAIVDPLSAAPKYPEIAALVIYGDNLEITQDPGISVLKPLKLILVNATIIVGRPLGVGLYDPIIAVASVEEALAAKPVIRAVPSEPTVYSVTA